MCLSIKSGVERARDFLVKRKELVIAKAGAAADPTWLILVFKLAADFGDRLAEVVG